MATQIVDKQCYYIMNAGTMTSLNILNSGGSGTPIVAAQSKFFQQPPNSVWQAQQQPNGWKFYNQQTNTYMWAPQDINNSDLQTWQLIDQNPKQVWTVAPSNQENSPIWFSIINADSGLVVDLVNNNPANAAEVVVATPANPSTNPAQSWVFVQSLGN